jgi:hypothetical protein
MFGHHPAMRLGVVLLLGLGPLTSCDDADSRTTAAVESVEPGKACLRPEDREQTELKGCFPITSEDAARLRGGECIDVRVPNYLDDANRDRPLEAIKVLDRPCK